MSVPNLIIAICHLQQSGELDKQTETALKNLVFNKNPAMLSLSSLVSTDSTPFPGFLPRAMEILKGAKYDAVSSLHLSSSFRPSPVLTCNSILVSSPTRSSSGSIDPNSPSKRRPAPISLEAKSAGKDEEEMKEQETQADALLRAKRDRAKKRQTMPSGGKIEVQQILKS